MPYRRYQRLGNTLPEIVEPAKSHRNNATQAKAILWEMLRGRKVCGAKFRRRHTFGKFVLDFWCPEYRLAIEVDGEMHEIPEVHERAIERQCWIEAHHVRVLRFRNDEVIYQTERVRLKIARLLQKDD